MIAIITLLVIIAMSIIVVRVGSVALELTGLPPEIASFQAQSAFSGVGFTTTESESIVTHPVRRKIIRILILVGSAGVTTSMATLVLAFVGHTEFGLLARVEVLFLGILIIYLFARSRHIYKVMKVVIASSLKRYTSFTIHDYEQLFGLGEGYAITKLKVKKGSPLIDKEIKNLRIELGEILVLGIYRREGRKLKLIGAPHGDTMIKIGDELVCYAQEEKLKSTLHI